VWDGIRVEIGKSWRVLGHSKGLIDGNHTKTARISAQAEVGTHNLRLRGFVLVRSF